MIQKKTFYTKRIGIALGLLAVFMIAASSMQSNVSQIRGKFSTDNSKPSYLVADPVELGAFDDAGPALDVEAVKESGKTYACVAQSEGGMAVLNVTNPANPVRISYYQHGNVTCYGLKIVETTVDGFFQRLAFLAYGTNGVEIVNITNLAIPVLIYAYKDGDGGIAHDVLVYGYIVYVAKGSAGLEVLILDASYHSMTQVSQVQDAGGDSALHLALGAGPRLYLADDTYGVKFFSINTPSQPVKIGQYSEGPSFHVYGVDSSGYIVYIGESLGGIRAINATNPAAPVYLGYFGAGMDGRDLKVSGSTIFAAFNSWLYVLNASKPTTIDVYDSFPTAGLAKGLSLISSPRYVYVAESENGVEIYNCTDITNIYDFSNHYETWGMAQDVYVGNGRTAFLANYKGIEIIDVTNPVNPVFRGKYNGGIGNSRRISTSANRLYVADQNDAMEILNISNLTHPVWIGEYADSGTPIDVVGTGNITYVADGTGGFIILNCTTLPTPTLMARRLNTPSNITNSITISGQYAYVTQTNKGMYIFNISNLTNPVLTGFYSRGTTPSYYRVRVSGSIAYICQYDSGIDLVNVSDPAHPVLIATWDPTPSVYDVSVLGDILFIATDTGLQIMNFSTPSSPVLVDSIVYTVGIICIWQNSGTLYAAVGNLGLRVLDSGLDNDDDGLSNAQEVLKWGTNMDDNDTDDDGLLDGAEVTRGTNPLVADSDADGLLDGAEVTRGTNPLVADTDGDGLLDGNEVTRGTNPLVTDSDGDGLLDGDEVTRGTNPLATDTDGDGYSDKAEVDAGTNPLDASSHPGTAAVDGYQFWLILPVIGATFIILLARKRVSYT